MINDIRGEFPSGVVMLRLKSSDSSSSSLRSMRSVTCRVVSSTEAPGQAALIVIVLMTKDGSSSRPRFW
jgi:hypothetical protein